MTSFKDDLSEDDDLIVRQHYRKRTSQEDDLSGRQPRRKKDLTER